MAAIDAKQKKAGQILLLLDVANSVLMHFFQVFTALM